MPIILFGFKSVGKTYFGSLLAKAWDLPFIDTDKLIEHETFQSCRQMAIEKGEAYFRQIEKKKILELVSTPSVISVGGGAVLDEENLDHLYKIGILIYLKINKNLLKKRLLSGELPSYIDSRNKELSFEKMYIMRKKQYEKIKAHVVSISNKTDQQVLLELKKYGKQ